jgi:N-acetylglucosaminyldiphosphoundecaprenol N-acetyl-beta-D-mannosaminyltransferase
LKARRPPRANVLGVGISRVNMASAVAAIAGWVQRGERAYVCIRDAHGVVLCQHDEELRRVHNEAGMVTPDGMPIVWFCRALGFNEVDRVYGPDLMCAVLADEELRRLRHFFLGGAPGVAEELDAALGQRYPGFKTIGIYAPPPEATANGIDAQTVAVLAAAKPDIVWVGLGSPKQERWMGRHHPHVSAAAMIGVGAAFDFLSGRKLQAPLWMQGSGLEWIYRLATEPRRLAGRYLRTVPTFLFLAALAATGLRRFPLEEPQRDTIGRNA